MCFVCFFIVVITAEFDVANFIGVVVAATFGVASFVIIVVVVVVASVFVADTVASLVDDVADAFFV